MPVLFLSQFSANQHSSSTWVRNYEAQQILSEVFFLLLNGLSVVSEKRPADTKQRLKMNEAARHYISQWNNIVEEEARESADFKALVRIFPSCISRSVYTVVEALFPGSVSFFKMVQLENVIVDMVADLFKKNVKKCQ